jgi:hypothetical protein
LKVAEAELEFASVIMTVLAPATDERTVNVAPENEPVASVLVAPLSVIGNPANVAVIVFEDAKPEPPAVFTTINV